MRCSIVIPTFNRRSLLARCLAAATSLDCDDYEILVADDASSDGTEAMVRRDFPGVRYFRLERNRGPAAARNVALAEARGDIVAFTDDDCLPPRDWLSAHLKHHRDVRVGAVGGLQIPESPNFFDKYQMASHAEEYRTLTRVEEIEGLEGLATSNMSVKRAAFARVGPFDEWFVTGEDPDLARRVCRAGYALVLDPSLRVTHLKVDTLGTYLRTRFHRGCGSVLTDIKEGTLSLGRFVPVVHPARASRRWREFRRLYDAGTSDLARFWMLAIAERIVVVAGRGYYYFRRGRSYRRRLGRSEEAPSR